VVVGVAIFVVSVEPLGERLAVSPDPTRRAILLGDLLDLDDGECVLDGVEQGVVEVGEGAAFAE
jgi:hypothetical protein